MPPWHVPCHVHSCLLLIPCILVINHCQTSLPYTLVINTNFSCPTFGNIAHVNHHSYVLLSCTGYDCVCACQNPLAKCLLLSFCICCITCACTQCSSCEHPCPWPLLCTLIMYHGYAPLSCALAMCLLVYALFMSFIITVISKHASSATHHCQLPLALYFCCCTLLVFY